MSIAVKLGPLTKIFVNILFVDEYEWNLLCARVDAKAKAKA